MKSFLTSLLPCMRRRLAQSNGSDILSRRQQLLFRSHPDALMVSPVRPDKQCQAFSKKLSIFSLQGDKLFSSVNQCHAQFSSLRKGNANANEYGDVEVEIISTYCIKPAVPTPEHLRTYEVSFLDQITPHFYMPFVYFYSNDHESNSDQEDLISKRRQLLKQSLSETLTRFYPLAGKVRDHRYIDCNDEGVYYVEAKVSHRLSDFLSQPAGTIRKSATPLLLPFGSNNSAELLSKTHVVMIQLTTFKCGGFAVGIYASHKIVVGYSYATFVNAWASTAAGRPEMCPNFTISPSIFPSTPAVSTGVPLAVYQTKTKRFVVGAPSLAKLRNQTGGGASRVIVVTGLIWKCIIKALKARSNNKKSSSAVVMLVNLRQRSSPPMPLYSMGNIVFWACGATQCLQRGGDDYNCELDSLAKRLKNSVDRLDGDFVEAMKGEEGFQKLVENLMEFERFYSDQNTEYLVVSSMCNSGVYEADFGWGKPQVCILPAGNPLAKNFLALMDTRCGNGVEAL